MSFSFYDSDGNLLTGSKFEQLSSDLASNVEITIIIESDVEVTSPVIFLMPSSALGTVDFPSKRPPYTDYNELLVWGSDNEVTQFGLYYKDENGIKSYFSLTSGSNYQNGISLGGAMAANTQRSIVLGYTPKDNNDIRRFYVGVEVYDSRANI